MIYRGCKYPLTIQSLRLCSWWNNCWIARYCTFSRCEELLDAVFYKTMHALKPCTCLLIQVLLTAGPCRLNCVILYHSVSSGRHHVYLMQALSDAVLRCVRSGLRCWVRPINLKSSWSQRWWNISHRRTTHNCKARSFIACDSSIWGSHHKHNSITARSIQTRTQLKN